MLCSLSASIPESSNDDASGSKLVDSLEDQVMNSGSDSPPSAAASDQQLTDKNESSSPQNLDSYGDIGLVRDNSPSYAPSESHQQVPPELPGFSVSLFSMLYDSSVSEPNFDPHEVLHLMYCLVVQMCDFP